MSTVQTHKVPFQRGVKNIVGTLRQGHIRVPFSKVAEVFGPPSRGTQGDQTAFAWAVTFEDGTVATIYDFKASSLYGEPDAPTPDEMIASEFEDWHVGGFSKDALFRVLEVLS